MYQLCRHILAAGRRCTQPAVGQTVYCRHHQVIQRTKEASVLPPKFHCLHRPLPFLYPEDRASITANVFLVLRALDDRRINTQQANTMNRLLRTCQINLNRGPLHESEEAAKPTPNTRRRRNDSRPDEDKESTSASDSTVHHVILTPEGEELAPHAEVWEEDEKQNHGETCPCLQCARQYHNAPSEKHHAKCKCADCVENRAQGTGLRAQENADTAADAVANTNTVAETPALDPSLELGGLASEDESPEPENPYLSPEPCTLSPELAPEPWMRPAPPSEPLVLTPEEKEKFERLEARYINDPSLAERIMDTYREIREQRLATEEHHPEPAFAANPYYPDTPSWQTDVS